MPGSSEKKNILWISFEDTNPFYGCYGDRTARTPNLDRLASQGCLYTHCFSTAGVCAPARSAIITGMYPTSIGTHHMRTTQHYEESPAIPTPYSAVLPHYVKCFTEYLRANGYYCTNNFKTDYQFEPPFTAWDECDKNAHWRNRRNHEQPFFSVFNLDATHESGMWPESCPEITFDPASVSVPPYFPDTAKVRQALARMYTLIERNDIALGRLLEQLEQDGLADNTVVFHWSDHGPLPRGKRWPYDSGIHVPMIIRWPGKVKPGSVSGRLISTVDLAPTVLSITGIPVPMHIQGQAFLGSRSKPPRKYVYATRDRYDVSYDMVRAVRDKKFKYIRNCRPELPYNIWVPYLNRHPIMQEMWRAYMSNELNDNGMLMFRTRPVEELYDTETDRCEIKNLAELPAYKKDLIRMRNALDKWLEKVGDMGKKDESEMLENWYPRGRQPQTEFPVFVPVSEEFSGMQGLPTHGTHRLKYPVLIQLYCSTQGASMGYVNDREDGERWHLYTAPFALKTGTTCIRAKAIRVGYGESVENTAVFIVE